VNIGAPEGLVFAPHVEEAHPYKVLVLLYRSIKKIPIGYTVIFEAHSLEINKIRRSNYHQHYASNLAETPS
jgi:hypothetical protein